MWKFLYFRKLAFFFAGTLCLLFFLFSCVTTISINNSYKNEIIRLNEQALEQSNEISTVILGDILRYTHNLYQYDSDLTGLMYAGEFTELSSVKASVLMPKLMSYSSLVDSYYIINSDGDYVCASSETVRRTEDFSDQNILELVRNSSATSRVLQFIPRKISINDGTTKQVISIIYSSASKSAFAINIDLEDFTAIVNGYPDSDSDSVKNLILNRYGQVLYHHDSSEFSADYTDTALYRTAVSQSGDSGTFTMNVDGKRQYISYQKGLNGLLFMKLTPNLLFDTTNSLLLKSLGYALLFLIIGALACLILSFILYRPIQELQKHILLSVPGEPMYGDELGQIAVRYQSIHEQNQHLKKKARAYQNEGRVKAVKQLLDSSFASITPLQGNLEEFSLNLEGPDYVVCFIRMDDGMKELPNEDCSLILYSIYNVLTELAEPSYLMEYVGLSSTELVCIMNHDSSMTDSFISLLEKTQEMIAQYFNITFSCGLGCTTPDLEQVSVSYRQSIIAVNHSFVKGSNSVNLYSQLKFTPEKEQIYPFSIEKSLVSAIKTLQPADASDSIQEFINKISCYYYERITLCCLQMNSCLHQLELQNDLETDDALTINDRSFRNHAIADIQRMFLARTERIIRSLSEIRSNNSEKNSVITHVMEFIAQNLYNPNLSVEMLAQEVHLSVNYLRNIFKEGTGTSLSNYIIEKKLELVCSLLTDTDLSIQDISDKLGFSTRNYFFTFFKKHTGYTPSQYRKTHLHDSPTL